MISDSSEEETDSSEYLSEEEPLPPPTPVTMATDNKEIRLNLPTPFDGNRDNLVSFLQDVRIYTLLNAKVYSTDEKKIIFILSFLTSRTAKAWKEAYLAEKLQTTPLDFGTLANFVDLLNNAFSVADSEGEARAQLRQLRQDKGTADEYISQFRILSGRSKITEDNSLIEYFMEGIHPAILERIFGLAKVPTTITAWCDHAARFDSQYRRLQEIKGRKKGTPFPAKKPSFTPRYVPNKDSHAMDIDRLSTEDMERHMKERRCFKCHRVGHQAKECRSNQTPSTTKIRSLIGEMEPKDKEELLKELKEDFQ